MWCFSSLQQSLFASSRRAELKAGKAEACLFSHFIRNYLSLNKHILDVAVLEMSRMNNPVMALMLHRFRIIVVDLCFDILSRVRLGFFVPPAGARFWATDCAHCCPFVAHWIQSVSGSLSVPGCRT